MQAFIVVFDEIVNALSDYWSKDGKQGDAMHTDQRMFAAMTGYGDDYVLWMEDQIGLLRARQFGQVDLDHVIAELEWIVKSQRRELRSRLEVVMKHLLKCQFQPNRRGCSWIKTLRVQRRELRELFNDSPSVRPLIARFAADGYFDAASEAAFETRLDASRFPTELPYSADQLLDVDFTP